MKTKATLVITFVVPTDVFKSFQQTFMSSLLVLNSMFNMTYIVESFTHKEIK